MKRFIILASALLAVLMGGGRAVVAAELEPVSCFDYYTFGAVNLNGLQPEYVEYASGEVVTFSGAIANGGTVPVVNAMLLGQITYNDYIIDEFTAATNVQLTSAGQRYLSFSWTLPALAPAGSYKLKTFLVSEAAFNISGLSFLETYPGGVTNFSVVGDYEFAPFLDRSAITFNGEPYIFNNLSPTIPAGTPINIKLPFYSNSPIGTAALELYAWDSLTTANKIENPDFNFSGGPESPFTQITSPGLSAGAYLLKVIANTDGQKTIFNLRFAVEGDAGRINILGLAEFPVEATEAYVCVHHSASFERTLPAKLTLAVLNGQKIISQGETNLTLTSDIVGYRLPVDLGNPPARNVTLKATLVRTDANQLLDERSSIYNCALAAGNLNGIIALTTDKNSLNVQGVNWCGDDLPLNDLSARVTPQDGNDAVIDITDTTSFQLAQMTLADGRYVGLFGAEGLVMAREFGLGGDIAAAPYAPYWVLVIAIILVVLIAGLLILALRRRGNGLKGPAILLLVILGILGFKEGLATPVVPECRVQGLFIVGETITITNTAAPRIRGSRFTISPDEGVWQSSNNLSRRQLFRFSRPGDYHVDFKANEADCEADLTIFPDLGGGDSITRFRVVNKDDGRYCVDFEHVSGPAYFSRICWNLHGSVRLVDTGLESEQKSRNIFTKSIIAARNQKPLFLDVAAESADWVEVGGFFDSPPVDLDRPIVMHEASRRSVKREIAKIGVGCARQDLSTVGLDCGGGSCLVNNQGLSAGIMASQRFNCEVKVSLSATDARGTIIDFSSGPMSTLITSAIPIIGQSSPGARQIKERAYLPGTNQTTPLVLKCVSPCNVKIKPGQSSNVTVVAGGGSGGAITLKPVNTPSDLTVNPISTTGKAGQDTPFTIKAAAKAVGGTYKFNLTASEGSATAQVPVTVVIDAAGSKIETEVITN